MVGWDMDESSMLRFDELGQMSEEPCVQLTEIGEFEGPLAFSWFG